MEDKHKLAIIRINGEKYLVQADVHKSTPGDDISFEIEGEFFKVEYFISKENK
jgi:hypothetical protein